MKISISQNDVKAINDYVYSRVPTKTRLPILESLAFHQNEDGALVVHTTDLDSIWQYTCERCIIDGLMDEKPVRHNPFIMPAGTVTDAMFKNKGACELILSDDYKSVTVTVFNAKHAPIGTYESALLDFAEYPAQVLFESAHTELAEYERAPTMHITCLEAFMNKLKSMTTFASDDKDRLVMASVYVSGEHMVASDGRRLTTHALSYPWTGEGFFLFPSSKAVLKKYPAVSARMEPAYANGYTLDENGKSKAYSRKWAYIYAGRFEAWIKTVDGQYPSYKQVVPTVKREHKLRIMQEHAEFYKRMGKMADHDKVGVTYDSKGMSVISADTTMRVNYDTGIPDDCVVTYDPRFVLDFLKFCECDYSFEIGTYTTDGEGHPVLEYYGPAVVNEGNSTYVLMPMRN